jgi:hypothetical protein
VIVGKKPNKHLNDMNLVEAWKSLTFAPVEADEVPTVKGGN